MSSFEALSGTSLGVFLGLTVVFAGGCAVMTGQALAATWRPAWQALPYSLLLAAAARFLGYALFNGVLLSPVGYGLSGAVLTVLTLAAFRATRARQMARQYPWAVQQTGLFSWRTREPPPGPTP